MPDLGKYSFEVLSAYGVTFVLLAALVLVSVWRARQMKTRLEAAEARRSTASTV
ncbi:heme exporter protein CcmD [Candidatus Halocynthiibacter alkanivorans]|jgi:heme exporter protein D|uniref:heme exporter protein CcmD n=1 Tax=Candidatus Halocynthiibacter alkanivorans TaxID=2267619 RepID=UPI000DF21F23|nr:heme exporter protein CcmD [Candidatus Halocynthiibacter alkanivorans]